MLRTKNWLVVWLIINLTYLPVILFHMDSIRLYALYSPCGRRCCSPVDVGSTSDARVSGAHDNRP